jgi:hypothetical protein
VTTGCARGILPLHWRVFDPATRSRPAQTGPIGLVFTITRGGGDAQSERFHIQVSIDTQRRFSDYCVNLEFPSAFLNPHTTYGPEVRELRTSTHHLLRATPENYTRILNPGNNNLMGFDFYIKRDGSQQELMDQVVRATAYVGDLSPVSIEHSIAELCNTENPTVFR